MSGIRVRGPWMWAWGLNILFMWALTFYGSLVRPDLLTTLGRIWAAWFFVQEMAGWYAESRSDGPELARTFSQVMQWFAYKDKGSSFWGTLTGWDAFVTMNCVGCGLVAGNVVADTWGLWGGLWVGLGVSCWNYFHWQNRRKHG